MKYRLKLDDYKEGGCAEFFDIVNHKNIGFKQFKNKKHCEEAFKTQKLLNKYNLAPTIYSKICKIQIEHKNLAYESNWGFITEKAKIGYNVKISDIQKLVDAIYKCTKKKFWDCHEYNVGYIKRNNKSFLVCVDTGNESFYKDYNAWGFGTPGPLCNYCQDYNCQCGV